MSFFGPAADEGRIPATDLAESLLALADLTQTTNALIQPGTPPVSVDVTAARRGSFIVDLVLRHQDVATQMVDIFSSQPMSALANLFEVLFSSRDSVMWLMKSSRGGLLRRAGTSGQGGHVLMETADGHRLSVPHHVAVAYDHVHVRQSMRRMVRPLASDGVQEMTVETETTTEIRLVRGDYEAFEEAATVSEGDTRSEPVSYFNQPLRVVQVSLERPLKWRFRHGDTRFAADIEDHEFLDRVDREGINIRPNDLLLCDFDLTYSEGARRSSVSGVVHKVRGSVRPGEQIGLFDRRGSDDGPEAEAS